jgi:hypothetical protein
MSKIKSPKAAKKPKAINQRKQDKDTRKKVKAKAKRRKSVNKRIDRAISVATVVLALISGGLDVLVKVIDSKKKSKKK